MQEQDEVENLLRVLIQLTGRSVFPEDVVREIVAPKSASQKLLKAYNLCDGTRTQSEICISAKTNSGNLSRAIAKWERAGVVYRVAQGKDVRPMHVYPLPEQPSSTAKEKGGK